MRGRNCSPIWGAASYKARREYVGQKMRQVKVTLKAGYRVLLLPPLE